MIVINKMTNRRLNNEIDHILTDIANEFSNLCDAKNTTIETVARNANIHVEKFLTGKFSLGQFIKLCYHLEISPSEILHKFYHQRQVILK